MASLSSSTGDTTENLDRDLLMRSPIYYLAAPQWDTALAARQAGGCFVSSHQRFPYQVPDREPVARRDVR